MSQVHSNTLEKVEPNFTPLLDLVLQLVMFFMMVVNFATNQVSESIQLPVMQSARPADKREADVLVLNLKADKSVEVYGEEPKKTDAEIRSFLRKDISDRKRSLDKGKDEKVKTIVVLRADKSVDFSQVYLVMRWCKEAGFTRFSVRAKTEVGGKEPS
jgi:biopolymer transport protein ExbD